MNEVSSSVSKPGSLTVHHTDDGAVWRVILNNGKGNILDSALIKSLTEVFRAAAQTPELKALCIEGGGKHFSFGASVAEHLPDRVESMLECFHEMFEEMLGCSVFIIAAVRGRCLGGGLELAAFCHRVVASPDAKLGQPEITLGVFAPVASVFLPERVGRGHADDLCVSGRVIDADEALAMKLVDQISENPAEAALTYAREHLITRSAKSLRFAVRAARCGLKQRFSEELQEVESLYLNELMATHDAAEGIRSFLEKRAPNWENR